MENPLPYDRFICCRHVSLRVAIIISIGSEDDLFYKNQQGTLYNYTEHKPSNTRLYENKRLVGVDFDLLPHKQQYIPKENI